MSTNKHASIRYIALDKCFSNFGRRYYIEDLIEECNKAIYEYSGRTDGVKRRQIFDDMTYMESDAGFSAEICRIRDGVRVYYRYPDEDYSINKKPLSQAEASKLKEAIAVLNRFRGLPQFEWMKEVVTQLEKTFSFAGTSEEIVGFENNPYLKGLDYFSIIFDSIANKQVLSISYRPFNKTTDQSFTIHPYYLKQYNNRWYLFGVNNGYSNITNIPLDRISQLTIDHSIKYRDNSGFDFSTYFEDVVGVTVPDDHIVDDVVLNVDKSQYPYIETKPLHESQAKISEDEDIVSIRLQVCVNYELKKLLLSYCADIEIIKPITLREEIYELLSMAKEKNHCAD